MPAFTHNENKNPVSYNDYTILNYSSGYSKWERGPLSFYAEGNVLVSMSRKPLLMAPLWPLIDTHILTVQICYTFLVSYAVVLLRNYKNRSYFSACGFVRCFDILNCTNSGSVCVGVMIMSNRSSSLWLLLQSYCFAISYSPWSGRGAAQGSMPLP